MSPSRNSHPRRNPLAPFEVTAPHEGAEPWEYPEEEPLEYEEQGEEAGAMQPPPGGLIGIGELFGKTWGVFVKRVLILILITILSYLLFGAGLGIFIGAGFALGLALPSMREGLAVGGVFAGVIAGLIASIWGYGAMIFAVADEKLGLVEAYRRAWQKVGSFIWLYIALFIIIIPGGFLLFLIPGILFIVWFSFAPFILAREDVRGMSAVIKSKEYVRGHFGDVFLRFLPILGILFVVWLIQWILAFIAMVVPVAPQLVSVGLSLVMAPFVMIFLYHIYQDLRRLKGDVAFPASGGEKAKWLGLGFLGWILGPILFLLIAGAAVIGTFMMFKAQF